jgi:ABC-type transport system involved in multi-copper enzyme maturation permease subunit
MEFFLPSLFILALAAIVVFVVFPKLAPTVLAGLALLLLAIGVYQHAKFFDSEYRLSTWQDGLVAYSPYIMIGGLLLVVLFFLLYLLPGRAPSMPDIPNQLELPPAKTATNVVTEAMNQGIRNVANIVGLNVKNQPAGNNLGNQVRNNGNVRRNFAATLGFPPSQV